MATENIIRDEITFIRFLSVYNTCSYSNKCTGRNCISRSEGSAFIGLPNIDKRGNERDKKISTIFERCLQTKWTLVGSAFFGIEIVDI